MTQKPVEKKINFRIVYLEMEIEVSCNAGEFRNLMVLINEKIYVEDFGECKGIGRCGTCLIEINASQSLPPSGRNELATLSKCSVKIPNLRLSCQIMIDKYLNGAVVKIIEDRVDVR